MTQELIKELLTQGMKIIEKGHCKGTLARNEHGDPANIINGDSFCAIGALHRAKYLDKRFTSLMLVDAEYALKQHALRNKYAIGDVVFTNDIHGKDAVLEMYTKAIGSLRAIGISRSAPLRTGVSISIG